MTLTEWVLIYFLTGFVLCWIAVRIVPQVDDDWRWDLAATLLWPLVIVGVLIANIRRRMK